MEQIKAMLEAVRKDPGLGEEIRVLEKKGNVEEIMGLAAKKGFVFTKANLMAYVELKNSQQEGAEVKELSQEELASVAGGNWFTANRYDPAVCTNIKERDIRCTGLLVVGKCDHYHQLRFCPEGSIEVKQHCVCQMGCFDYISHTFV